MSQNRRLAAILSADVAGYSRLTEADEGSTLGAPKAIKAQLLDPMIAQPPGVQAGSVEAQCSQPRGTIYGVTLQHHARSRGALQRLGDHGCKSSDAYGIV